MECTASGLSLENSLVWSAPSLGKAVSVALLSVAAKHTQYTVAAVRLDVS